MLGVDEEAERAEHVLDLPRDSVVLLFTDGLIERRGSSLDAGLDLVCTHLADFVDRPVDEICDELLDRMLPETPPDDVALVAVRLTHAQPPPATAP
jgi:serine phosphatase RsbU (regulator of sigma subunit)